MKIPLPKLTKHTALILLVMIYWVSAVFADDQSDLSTSLRSDKNLSVTKQKVLAEREQQRVTEAAEAVSGTQQAVQAIDRMDFKTARSILQTVSKKLDNILATDPTLALVPADIESDMFVFKGDADAINQEIKKADNLLDGGKIQEARQILIELASEIRITISSIPLGSFPVAIKEAIALLDAGKSPEAANRLNEVLNLLVKTTEIIPLPLLGAEALLNEASELEHKKGLSKDKRKDEVLKLTSEAKEELKVAQILGYGSQDDYQRLYTAIDDIEDGLHSEKPHAAWGKVKQTLAELKNKLIHFIKR